MDEVVAAVITDWKPGMDSHAAYLRLLQEMHMVLDKEVRESRIFGEMVSLEAPTPIDPADQAENMVGEEFYEFWQPDEILRIEDVFGDDKTSIPDLYGRDEQEAGYLLRLLRELPIIWRRAFLLHELEKVPKESVAKLLNVKLSDISDWIKYAHQFIEKRLKDAGFDVDITRLISMFRGKSRK